ncbi:glycosyltransferase family 2 protein [Altericroceibacterium spongiae]|uniref:Glycosyltransferase family 2 protein n=1 Tax=Altericroceibacterium spongiae TaxID=2320269 RepID=A0A420EMH3_9SPHN|nr:glycosyltransferase family 2 protein [Altericroceibacterium spongiae]RKF21863.1 glycosyltransferase family 2 protein [Altericroceibacterium spongiae]
METVTQILPDPDADSCPAGENPPAGALQLAVILPTLNERANIAPMVARLDQALGAEGWEAIFVDDNSRDGTADEIRRIARTDPRIRVIQRIGRRGLSGAAIEGMCATAAPFVAVMDADHQHDPALLRPMLQAVRSGEADIAIASRFAQGGTAAGLASESREAGSRIANALARKLTGTELSDAMSGYFLLRTEQLRAQAGRLSGIGFKILLDILGSAPKSLKVKEFPLTFAARAAGESKLDNGVALDFLAGLYERYLGRIVPTRFALFGTVGAIGIGVHMAVLSLLYLVFGSVFALAQSCATLAAMTFNFWLNNFLTYRDQKLSGWKQLLTGWAGFCLTCLIGAAANIGVATLLQERGFHWWAAALIGILLGSVWNYALSSRFIWGRYK